MEETGGHDERRRWADVFGYSLEENGLLGIVPSDRDTCKRNESLRNHVINMASPKN